MRTKRNARGPYVPQDLPVAALLSNNRCARYKRDFPPAVTNSG